MDKLQDEFYEKLPTGNKYIKVDLAFSPQYNNEFFEDWGSSYVFYAQRRESDIIAFLLVEKETYDVIIYDAVGSERKTIEIEGIYPEEGLEFNPEESEKDISEEMSVDSDKA